MRPLVSVPRPSAYRRLLAGRAVSVVGDGAGTLALVVLVQDRRDSATAVALLLLAVSLPRLLSPLAGAVVDRLPPGPVLVGGELLQAVAVGALLVALPPLPLIVGLVTVKAAIAMVSEAAGRALVPAVVEDDDLPAANALLSGAREVGEVFGPLLGGALVAVGGARAGLGLDALTFVLAVPLLIGVGGSRIVSTEPLAASVVTGVRLLWSDALLRTVTLGFLLVGLAAADDVALPFLARDLGGGAPAIGGLYASVAAGLVVGYGLIARRAPPGAPAVGFALGVCVAGVGNLLAGVAPALALAVVGGVIRGLGTALLDTSLQTLLQRRVPAPLLGRAFANVYGGVNITALVALAGAGPLVDATSPRVALLAAGAVCLLAAAVVASRTPRIASTAPP